MSHTINRRLEQKSRENMVRFYRYELDQIRGGQGALEVLSDNVRKRFVDYGVLTKRYDAGAYFVTPLGEELLTELRANEEQHAKAREIG